MINLNDKGFVLPLVIILCAIAFIISFAGTDLYITKKRYMEEMKMMYRNEMNEVIIKNQGIVRS